jgi:hypothetical protein
MSTPTDTPRTEHPSKCPITGLPFFMEIDGEPTYGGPFNSYTIPVFDAADAEFSRRNYDHDHGAWNEGTEWVQVEDDVTIEHLQRELAAVTKERDRLKVSRQEPGTKNRL